MHAGSALKKLKVMIHLGKNSVLTLRTTIYQTFPINYLSMKGKTTKISEENKIFPWTEDRQNFLEQDTKALKINWTTLKLRISHHRIPLRE